MVFFQCRLVGGASGATLPPTPSSGLETGGGSTPPQKNVSEVASVWIEEARSEWLHQYRLRNGSGIPAERSQPAPGVGPVNQVAGSKIAAPLPPPSRIESVRKRGDPVELFYRVAAAQ